MAYEIGYDIIVKDSEIKTVKEYCNKKSEELEDYIKTFKSILNDILTKGVTSGEFHDKIEIFKVKVDKLQGEVDGVTKEICKQLTNFLKDFDTADSYLY